MIYVRLMGGLGNQMFQYATGKALASRHGVGLRIDTSFLERDPKGEYIKRPYELNAFRCNPRVLGLVGKLWLKSNKYVAKATPGIVPRLYREEGFRFNKNFAAAGRSVILVGYWQSQEYFKEIRNELLQDFELAKPLSQSANEVSRKIAQTRNSISIHFRRGDYVSLASAASVHGTPSLDYYTAAVKFMTETQGAGHMFVFSDDIKWVRENFPLPSTTYVEGLSGMEDMVLMSRCQHNIIANSSFSWWSAWLNANPDKIVIAPKQWFADTSIDTRDLIPADWKRI